MSLLYILAGARSAFLNIVSVLFSLTGEEIFFLCALGVLFWCFSKRSAYKLFFAYISASSVLNIINAAVHMPPPWVRFHSYQSLGIIEEHFVGYTFPLNSIFNATVLALGIFISFRRLRVKALCVLLLALNVFSALYLGLCTVWSAALSVAIGAAAVLLFNIFIEGTLFDESRYRIYAGVMLIPVFVLICAALSLYFNDVISLDAMSGMINRTGIYIVLLGSWYVESLFIRFTIRCDRMWKQFVKALCGVSAMLILYFSLTLLFMLVPGFRFGGLIRNLITASAGFGAYPLIIRRFFAARYSKSAQDPVRL